MSLFRRRCRDFAFLLNETEDRELSQDETAFVESHQAQCVRCRRLAQGSVGLNLLRSTEIPLSLDSRFDERLLRRLEAQNMRGGFLYWSPALVSGAIAGLAILAAIQMIVRPDALPTFSGPSEARRNVQPAFPELKELSPDAINR